MSDYSVLLLAFGQSNADLYPASPALDVPVFRDPRILTFNEPAAWRGLLGRPREGKAPGLAQAQWASNRTRVCSDYQSFQIAAAARLLYELNDPHLRHVIIRSEGRAGRRFGGAIVKGEDVDGILTNLDGSDSQILLNALDAIALAANRAPRRNAPLQRVIVTVMHGESDRATSRIAYRSGLETMIDRIDGFAAGLGLPVDWLIMEPGGTTTQGGGNAWPCRLAMHDVAGARENVHLTGCGYPYALDDVIHHNAETRLLIGDHLGAAAAQLLAQAGGRDLDFGWLLDVPAPAEARLAGTTVDLRLGGDEPFEVVSGLSDSNLTVEGFATTIKSRCRVTGVQPVALNQVRITLDRPPKPSPAACLTYAFQIVRGQDKRIEINLAAGRGGWRSVRSLQSLTLPGRQVHQWVPGFCIPFAEMQQG